MPSAETARLVAELTLKDKMSAGLKTADKNLRSFDKSTANTQKSLSKFGSNVGKAFAIGGAAIVAGGVLSINAAADFESAFAGVRKTVEATPEELDKLALSFRGLATEIPISAVELASLGEAAGALGIEGTDNIKEFVRVTALLGETTDVSAEDAATSLGVLSNVLGLTADDYSKFASTLVELGNAGASTESAILEIATRAGAAGELIGLSTEQVLGFSSAVASLGIEPEAAGTALQRTFIELAESVAEGGDELKTFAKIAGKSTQTFKENFEKDAGAALRDFLEGLGKLDQGAQIEALKELGLDGANLTRVLLGLGNNAGLVADQLGVAEKAFDSNTALTKEAGERFKTFDSQVTLAKNTLNEVAIVIGSKLLPKLTPLIQRFSAFIKDNQGNIEKFGTDLATAFEQVADAVGKTDWTPFIDGLRMSAELAKGAFNAFRSLPKEFQALILVGAGVNKITGGLLTSLAKDTFKIGFEQVFAKGSSPANPLWVQSVGGGVGGPGGDGGGKNNPLVTAFKLALAAGAGLTVGTEVARAGGASVGDDPLDNLKRIALGFGAIVNQGHALDLIGGEVKKTNVHLIDQLAVDKAESAKNQQDAFAIRDAVNQSKAQNQQDAFAVRDAVNADKVANQQAAFAVRDAVNTKVGLVGTIMQSVKSAADSTTAAARAAGQQTAFAIRDKDLSVSVSTTNVINNRVSVRETINTQTTYKQFQKFIS